MRKNDLRRRLSNLQEIIRPADSLEARIAALSLRDRAVYERWLQRCQEHFEQHETEPGGYWEAYLDGKLDRPELPHHIDRQLYPEAPQILETDDEATARDKYELLLEQGR